MSITFKRKIYQNHGSHFINIPKEIVEALILQKGDVLEITFENGSFLCKKKED